MQLARSSTDAVQSWLAVECRGLGLLLPLEQAGEIHAYVPPTPVPHTQPWFRGVVNLRGGLFGAIDLGAYLGIVAANLTSQDVVLTLVKGLLFGLVIGLLPSHAGLSVRRGPTEIPQAVIRGTVGSIAVIFVLSALIVAVR